MRAVDPSGGGSRAHETGCPSLGKAIRFPRYAAPSRYRVHLRNRIDHHAPASFVAQHETRAETTTTGDGHELLFASGGRLQC